MIASWCATARNGASSVSRLTTPGCKVTRNSQRACRSPGSAREIEEVEITRNTIRVAKQDAVIRRRRRSRFQSALNPQPHFQASTGSSPSCFALTWRPKIMYSHAIPLSCDCGAFQEHLWNSHRRRTLRGRRCKCLFGRGDQLLRYPFPSVFGDAESCISAIYNKQRCVKIIRQQRLVGL